MPPQVKSLTRREMVGRYGPLALVLTLGLTLRLRPFLFNRSLWLDEAMLALNVVRRGFLSLAAPLDDAQSAPLGFLWLSHAFVVAFGNRDQVLRLVPFLAAVSSLVLLAWFARRAPSRAAGWLALLLYALSNRAIYYAAEFKQYATDTLMALLLLVVATPCLIGPWQRRRVLVWGLLSALAIWFSHPAVFVFAGIWTALLVARLRAKDAPAVKTLVMVLLLAAVSFAGTYFLTLRSVGAHQGLYRFWSDFFMPLPPWAHFGWLWKTARDVMINPVGLALPALGVALFLIGALYLLAAQLPMALALLLPLAYTLAASALRQYPFGDRMLLFAIPSVLIIVAHGVAALGRAARHIPYGEPIIWLACATALVAGPAIDAARTFQQPFEGEQMRPAIASLAQQRESADLVYIYYPAYPAWRYYAPQFGLEEQGNVIRGRYARTEPEKYAEDLAHLPAYGRLWLLFSHVYTGSAGNEEELIMARVKELGEVEQTEHFPGATLYLLTLGNSPPNE